MQPDASLPAITPSVRRRLRADRRARRVVALGGVTIVACILGILVFLVLEAAPLAARAHVAVGQMRDLAMSARAVVVDDLASHAVCADRAGNIHAYRLDDGEIVTRARLRTADDLGPLVDVIGDTTAGFLAGAGDGKVFVTTVGWRNEYATQRRTTAPVIGTPQTFDLDAAGRTLTAWTVSRSVDGQLAVAAQTAEGALVLVRQHVTTNEFTGEVETSEVRSTTDAPVALHLLCLDRAQSNLYGASVTGRIFWWRVTDAGIEPPRITRGPSGDVTAMQLLLGDQSLIVGTRTGQLTQWSPVREDGVLGLRVLRSFNPLPTAIRRIDAASRSKAFAVLADEGFLALCFATTGDQRWTGVSPLASTRSIALAPRGDHLLAVGAGSAASLDVDDPHPEATLDNLFSPVWYENYDAPTLTWQSTPGTDSGEPKLSLTPLLWGTLKATLACLLLSVPIALLAALFVSQFAHPSLRAWLKPTVELMAALPSVVLGFVAAVWLAPHLERVFLGLLLAAFLVPALAAVTGTAAARIPARLKSRWRAGSELLPICAIVVLTTIVCVDLTPAVEDILFGSDFPTWVRGTLGLDYDQKNAVVVAMAMAIAVIPIVFSIAEESFHNVPRSLVSASLALGANRWETAVRVVVPAASPGLFSAVMVGFGRAIGETMIVLMAVGATPIMDLNPFTGFRTLSANVAIEIPEAPHGGTLYRVLFLAALLLFALTFVLNSAAEVVRARLRRRHAAL